MTPEQRAGYNDYRFRVLARAGDKEHGIHGVLARVQAGFSNEQLWIESGNIEEAEWSREQVNKAQDEITKRTGIAGIF